MVHLFISVLVPSLLYFGTSLITSLLLLGVFFLLPLIIHPLSNIFHAVTPHQVDGAIALVTLKYKLV